jgi:hypothetical protein
MHHDLNDPLRPLHRQKTVAGATFGSSSSTGPMVCVLPPKIQLRVKIYTNPKCMTLLALTLGEPGHLSFHHWYQSRLRV